MRRALPLALSLLALLAIWAAGCSSKPHICKLGSDECGEGASCVSGECKQCPACGEGQRCVAATCLSEVCNGRVCPSGSGCVNGECVEESCVGVACGTSERCAAGHCVATECNGVACRAGEVCDNGACVTAACIGVVCPSGQSCANGACVETLCGATSCATGAACVSGSCVDTRCAGVVCASGFICAGGLCQPTSCESAACPAGQACINGQCSDAACVGVVCASGTCVGGTCVSPGGCQPSDPPLPCGETGSSCTQSCVNGQRAACLPPAGAFDPMTDPSNCGNCGHVCPAPPGATASCSGGVCGRGGCAPGRFDFNNQPADGCEVTCVGTSCTDASGTPIPVSVPPLPETGVMFDALSSATSLGGFTQSNSAHTNFGILAEPTPLIVGGGTTESSNATYRNVGGFQAVLRGAPP
ncbi:MAG: hypothetical protein ACJ790_15400 [Myxococcaceae bacterium]